jgi:hypothetical protein
MIFIFIRPGFPNFLAFKIPNPQVNRMHTLKLILILLFATSQAWADGKADCASGYGDYLTGSVTKPAYFQAACKSCDPQLTHTHITIASTDGNSYDVAIDNVFTEGYDQAAPGEVPAPLNSIKINDKLAMCGQLYANGRGIHWVHNNCGARPDRKHPDGWLKKLSAVGDAGPSLTGYAGHCDIFRNKKY